MPQASFGPLESWQKRECLFCGRRATRAAHMIGPEYSSSIRCCDRELCGQHALALAAVQPSVPQTSRS